MGVVLDGGGGALTLVGEGRGVAGGGGGALAAVKS